MRLPTRIDVLVVGCGPAGAATALRLAAAGREVLLVDRAEFPRPKVCGDGLTPRAIASLQSLDVWRRVEPRATRVDALRTYDLTTRVIQCAPLPNADPRVPSMGAVVPRIVLDDALRAAAIAAGARFVPDCDLRVMALGGRSGVEVEMQVGGRLVRLHAETLVGADGANSRIARSAVGCLPGVVRGVAVRQYWWVSVPAAFTICIPLSRGLEDVTGYGWVFPVGSDMANVGVGIVGAGARHVRGVYDRFIETLRAEHAGWGTAMPCGALEGGALAAGMTRDRVARERVLLVGDAAGAVNPYSGEGIAQALDGAEAAANAILREPRGWGLHDAYWSALQARFSFSTRDTEWLSWLLARGASFAREFWHGAARPTGVLGATARRMTLDELVQPDSPSQPGTATMECVAELVGTQRPMLGRIVRALSPEVAPIVSEGIAALRGRFARESVMPAEVEQVVALVTVMLAVIADVPRGVPAERSIDVRDVAEWSRDAAALGVVDLLLTESLQRLAMLPAHWCEPVSAAVGAVIARRTHESAAGERPMELGPSMDELVRKIEAFASRDVAQGAAVA